MGGRKDIETMSNRRNFLRNDIDSTPVRPSPNFSRWGNVISTYRSCCWQCRPSILLAVDEHWHTLSCNLFVQGVMSNPLHLVEVATGACDQLTSLSSGGAGGWRGGRDDPHEARYSCHYIWVLTSGHQVIPLPPPCGKITRKCILIYLNCK